VQRCNYVQEFYANELRCPRQAGIENRESRHLDRHREEPAQRILRTRPRRAVIQRLLAPDLVGAKHLRAVFGQVGIPYLRIALGQVDKRPELRCCIGRIGSSDTFFFDRQLASRAIDLSGLRLGCAFKVGQPSQPVFVESGRGHGRLCRERLRRIAVIRLRQPLHIELFGDSPQGFIDISVKVIFLVSPKVRIRPGSRCRWGRGRLKVEGWRLEVEG